MATALGLRAFLSATFSDVRYRIVEHWGVRDDAGMMRQISPDTAAVV
jgi:predicted ester cyclase